ncbi:uncharacterized protein LOC143049114 [Mytilus galloprovincialis]|uniref:uncharacterized protein LOC143049114 n=1 Tax=Mytilus galloprovincialis TaxID=29158 RepID=UPI003F7C28A9
MLFSFCTLFIVPLCQAHVKGWFWGGGGGGSSGVTAEKIADKAYSHKDSTEWAFEGCKGGKKFCKANKCNLFVNDVLKSVGATVPKRYTWWYSPISANDWGNPNSSKVKSTGCYSLVSSFLSKQRGDVIAFPASSGSGHVGIVYDGNAYISAGKNQVNKKGIPSVKSTIWRYKYDDNNCYIAMKE